MRIASCFVGVISLSPVNGDCLSQSGDKSMSPHFAECMESVDLGAMKNSQFEACHRAELKVQDRQLNDEYKNLHSRTTSESRTLLTNAQKAWILHRESWCKYEGSLDAAPSPEVNHVACLMDMAAAQAKRPREQLKVPSDVCNRFLPTKLSYPSLAVDSQ